MGGHDPEVWISDRYSAQQKHGAAHQTCLAHLARDTAFALEHGSDDLPLRFKLWFGKAFDLPERSPVSKPRRSPAKSASLKSKSRPFLPRRPGRMRPRTPVAGQNRSGAAAASDLLRLSRRGRGHQQHFGAKAAALRDPAKSHKRLPSHVGRPSLSGCAHNRRCSKAKGRKPLF